MQTDLDKWIDHYNRKRTHTSKYCLEEHPMQT